jgi:hypothetical protein
MKQIFIPWVKYMYSTCKDAWESTHTIHRWTPTITYITPNLKEIYITLNKLLKILLQIWRLTMSSSLSLQTVAASLNNYWRPWTWRLSKLSQHVIETWRVVTHIACCQLQNCAMAFHTEQASSTCLLTYQYDTMEWTTLHSYHNYVNTLPLTWQILTSEGQAIIRMQVQFVYAHISWSG